MALNIARKFSREKIISYFAREFAVEIAVTGLPMLLGIKLQTAESKQDAFGDCSSEKFSVSSGRACGSREFGSWYGI
jgi:hypothetical protein